MGGVGWGGGGGGSKFLKIRVSEWSISNYLHGTFLKINATENVVVVVVCFTLF